MTGERCPEGRQLDLKLSESPRYNGRSSHTSSRECERSERNTQAGGGSRILKAALDDETHIFAGCRADWAAESEVERYYNNHGVNKNCKKDPGRKIEDG
jgi:hypothetical protein